VATLWWAANGKGTCFDGDLLLTALVVSAWFSAPAASHTLIRVAFKIVRTGCYALLVRLNVEQRLGWPFTAFAGATTTMLGGVLIQVGHPPCTPGQWKTSILHKMADRVDAFPGDDWCRHWWIALHSNCMTTTCHALAGGEPHEIKEHTRSRLNSQQEETQVRRPLPRQPPDYFSSVLQLLSPVSPQNKHAECCDMDG
jgi:hypothetical protein